METLSRDHPDFKTLQQLRRDGYNLRIVGPDGFPMPDGCEAHYLNPSAPFGHERLYVALLTIEDAGDYPWRKHGQYLKHLE